jgi:hypothetical protein
VRSSRALGLLLGLAACGGAAQPVANPGSGGPGDGGGPAPVTDARASPAPPTPIDRRRDAACDRLGPKLTACAVEDAKADLAAGKVTQQQLARDTAPEIQRKNTEEFAKACKSTAYSSRQIRVLEVCFRDEPRCAPLLDCLGHLSDAPSPGAKQR